MATTDQCQAALEQLADKLRSSDSDRKPGSFDRTLSCHVPDLGITFSGRLQDGSLLDITTEESPKAQIRLTAGSDDLLALSVGTLAFGPAWLAGKVKVEAGMLDLLKLRSML